MAKLPIIDPQTRAMDVACEAVGKALHTGEPLRDVEDDLDARDARIAELLTDIEMLCHGYSGRNALLTRAIIRGIRKELGIKP